MEPMLNDRPFADNFSDIALANRTGCIVHGRHAEVNRCCTGTRVVAVDMDGIVQDLVFVLSRPIIDATVATPGDLAATLQGTFSFPQWLVTFAVSAFSGCAALSYDGGHGSAEQRRRPVE